MLTDKVKQKFNYYSTNDHPSMEHFNTFYHFGKKCDSIVEMGVDYAVSTWAWVACESKYLRAIDIRIQPSGQHGEIQEECAKMGMDYRFEIADTGHGILKYIADNFKKDIYPPDQLALPYYNLEKEVDLLYIDTYHSYTHLKAELAIHAGKVKKYLVFHDTDYFGEEHPYDGDKGLNPAIREFLEQNNNWQYLLKVRYGNGLTVLGNTNNVDDEPNMNPDHRYPTIRL